MIMIIAIAKSRGLLWICLAGMVILMGCNDEFLEKQPQNAISVDEFFQSETDVELALNGVYDVFQGSIWGGAFYWMPIHFDAAADNAFNQYPWEGQFAAIGRGEHSAATGGVITWKWRFGYMGINRVNSILENIDQVEIDDATKNRLLGEARFLRGLFYSDMIFHYGDVPLVLTILKPEERFVARTPKAEVLDQIYEDLDFAAQNLPLSYTQTGDIGRPTKASALALKARTQLYNGDFAQAAASAQEVMNLGSHRLLDDYGSIFELSNENNAESIFEIQFIDGQVGEGNYFQTVYGPSGSTTAANNSGWGSLSPFQELIDEFPMIDGLPIGQSPLYDPDDPFNDRDPRLFSTVFLPGVDMWRGEVYEGTGTQTLTLTPYVPKKYVITTPINSQVDDGPKNYMVIRYADVLLMYAEAQNEAAGPDATVYDAVNQVRNRAGMPDLPAGLSQQGMREQIRLERRVEFAFEGTRYHDLIRWRTAETELPGVTFETRGFNPARDYLWPVPQAEIDANPALEQNPGY